METAVALGIGLALGVRHAADPDHVLAIAQLARPGGSAVAASKTALSWGLGHSLTIMCVGAALIATGAAMPDVAADFAQLVVATMLVVLAWRAPSVRRPPHATRRAVVVGLVHGAAGAGGATLLALSAAPEPAVALLSLAAMCIGTTAAMVAMTLGLMASSSQLAPRLLHALIALSRVLAVAVAVAMVWSVFVS